MLVIWVVGKKPDVGMTGNGALAGLVGITAGCAFVEPWAAVVIGVITGGIVVFSVMLIDRIHIDDPVGAISVHGVCGAVGTLAVGLFASTRLIEAAGVGSPGLLYGGGTAQLGVQALGVVAVAAWALGGSAIVFAAIKATAGLRVSREEEIEGLDIGEHGMYGYPDTFLGTDAIPTTELVKQARDEARARVEGVPVLQPDAT